MSVTCSIEYCGNEQSHLSGPVKKVILQISDNAFLPIIKYTMPRSFSRPGEARFESPGASVRRTDRIAMVGPRLAKLREKVGMLFNGLVIGEDVDRAQLSVEDPFCKSGLNNVRAIQVVHAVRAYTARLEHDGFRFGGVKVEVPSIPS